MNIIRGEPITEIATLTATKELRFSERCADNSFFLEDERAKAYHKGQDAGEKIGYAKALYETKGLLDLLQTLTRKLLEQKKRLLDQLKPEIIEFSIAVCEKVIRKELSQPETLVRLINSLLSVRDPNFQHEHLKIILAPEDLLLLEKYLTQISYDKREIEGVSFWEDSLIRRGDCRIEGQTGLLNYSIARELSDLSAKVLLR